MATTAERHRRYEGIPLFSMGFRPFFLAAGIWATLAVPLWMAGYFGWAPQINRDWHVHEMLFGYLSSVIAGFLLTAIPNWTGRLPLAGSSLFVLFSLWCLGRLAMLAAPESMLGGILDSMFLIALACVIAREIIAGKNIRNLPVCVIVSLLALANILTHLRFVDVRLAAHGERGALALVAMLLALIGGRITPSFTRNWLAKQRSTKMPTPTGRFDTLTLAITGLTLVGWVTTPDSPPTGAALIVTGAFNAARLARWCGRLTFGEPLLAVLHVGYAWLALALTLLGRARPVARHRSERGRRPCSDRRRVRCYDARGYDTRHARPQGRTAHGRQHHDIALRVGQRWRFASRGCAILSRTLWAVPGRGRLPLERRVCPL